MYKEISNYILHLLNSIVFFFFNSIVTTGIRDFNLNVSIRNATKCQLVELQNSRLYLANIKYIKFLILESLLLQFPQIGGVKKSPIPFKYFILLPSFDPNIMAMCIIVKKATTDNRSEILF